jgi:hypothetical protein
MAGIDVGRIVKAAEQTEDGHAAKDVAGGSGFRGTT